MTGKTNENNVHCSITVSEKVRQKIAHLRLVMLLSTFKKTAWFTVLAEEWPWSSELGLSDSRGSSVPITHTIKLTSSSATSWSNFLFRAVVEIIIETEHYKHSLFAFFYNDSRYYCAFFLFHIPIFLLARRTTGKMEFTSPPKKSLASD